MAATTVTRPPIPRAQTTVPPPKPVAKAAVPAANVRTQAEASEMVDRLGKARARCEEFLEKKNRLSGELDAANRRRDELEAKCKADFDCDSAELPGLVEQMKTEVESKAVEVETRLGLREAVPAE